MTRRPFDRPSPARLELDALIRKNLRFSLGPYLRRVAQASVAAALISGCGVSHSAGDGGGGTDAGDWVDAAQVDAGLRDAGPWDAGSDGGGFDAWVPPPPEGLCAPDGTWRAVHGLAPVSPRTYVSAHEVGEFTGLVGTIDEVGTACADATSVPACEAALTDLRGMTWERALITTDGDLVEAITGPGGVRAFLGPIDTVNEAALLAWVQGYGFWCAGDFTSTVTEVPGGYEVIAYTQGGGCGTPWVTTRHTLFVDAAGEVTVLESVVVREEEDLGCIGRRPVGLQPGATARTTSAVGDYFANVARLEASAVVAFDVMLDELRALGAPASLMAAAEAARADEVEHTASMGALALRYGVQPAAPTIDAAPARTPFEIALENAVEGCVRETFGALVGAFQALRASDPAIADTMRTVADDEIRHAELSWALAGWLEPQLTGDERARIQAAKRAAIDELRVSANKAFHPDVVRIAGMPEPAAAVAMVDHLAAEIWA